MTDETWDEIHTAIAEDCYSLYFDGIQVTCFKNQFFVVGSKLFLKKFFLLDPCGNWEIQGWRQDLLLRVDWCQGRLGISQESFLARYWFSMPQDLS